MLCIAFVSYQEYQPPGPEMSHRYHTYDDAREMGI